VEVRDPHLDYFERTAPEPRWLAWYQRDDLIESIHEDTSSISNRPRGRIRRWAPIVSSPG
jgi:hypothetical protein